MAVLRAAGAAAHGVSARFEAPGDKALAGGGLERRKEVVMALNCDLFLAPRTGPQTHAIVIGVGDYPFLKGGTGPTHPRAEGMGQLTTSTASARAIVKWLCDAEHGYYNPERPLGSVRVLLSEPSPRTLKDAKGEDMRDPTGAPFLAPRADLQNVVDAVGAWYQSLDQDERELGVFFFAGHGVMAGQDQALLPSDFGSQRFSPYAGSISFNQMYAGAAQAKSREQCYFIDACRTNSRGLAAADTGHPIIESTPEGVAAQQRPRAAPVFNATLVGESAYGPSGQPSFFATALLEALKGAGADNLDDETVWRCETHLLNRAMGFLIAQLCERYNVEARQIAEAYAMSSLYLHTLRADPVIPIAVRFDPAQFTARTEISCGGKRLDRGSMPFFLSYGDHTIRGDFAGPPVMWGEVKRSVRPPFVPFSIPLVKTER